MYHRPSLGAWTPLSPVHSSRGATLLCLRAEFRQGGRSDGSSSRPGTVFHFRCPTKTRGKDRRHKSSGRVCGPSQTLYSSREQRGGFGHLPKSFYGHPAPTLNPRVRLWDGVPRILNDPRVFPKILDYEDQTSVAPVPRLTSQHPSLW